MHGADDDIPEESMTRIQLAIEFPTRVKRVKNIKIC